MIDGMIMHFLSLAAKLLHKTLNNAFLQKNVKLKKETETYGLKFRSRDFYQQNVHDPFFFATGGQKPSFLLLILIDIFAYCVSLAIAKDILFLSNALSNHLTSNIFTRVTMEKKCKI